MTYRFACIALALLCSCASEDADGTTLSLSFTNLPELGGDFVYEGWLIVDGSPVTTGRFTVDSNGDLSESTFELDDASRSASAFVLTIEPGAGDDPAPSSTHLVAGDFVDDMSDLTMNHEAALATDFSDATAELILETPSSEDTTDYAQGIWYLVPGEPPSAGLNLPTLPDGWAYEGWIVGDDGPVSTGRFTDPAAADDDAAGPAAGPGSSPPFPGQDFIDPATDLSTGHMAVISVEPEPDDGAAPFVLKPLVGALSDVAPPTTQTLTNMASGSAVSGAAVFSN